MENMKLIVGDDTYVLVELPSAYFRLSQTEPYPFEHKKEIGDTYTYRSILIEGKYYGFQKVPKIK